ncbi:MAG: HD domain-containing protein [Burkholderiales bacterium]|nr:HD domain-containing protein [Burkholderiales bacterium]
MTSINFAPSGAHTNPDLLQSIIKASETYSIVASQDIVDIRGLKLWAKGQPVSAALQQRLLERKLKNPLESCLMAEDGVTPFTLLNELTALWAEEGALSHALRPHAAVLEKQLKQIPLHPVAQLLLTTALATRPDSLPHAVRAMALAGAMAQAQSSPVDTRLAMLGGLLHDIGEAYIQPQYLDPEKPLDLLGHKHMMVHPRMAQVLLSSTTDYPVTLCRAVGEHHERLNGSGYPARLSGEAISPLGMLLAAVEVTMGISRNRTAPLTRASFALRVVPGEFPSRYSSVIFNMARDAKEEVPHHFELPEVALEHINTALNNAQQTAQAQQTPSLSTDARLIVSLALERLARLRLAWNALGVWGMSPTELTAQDHFEMSLAGRELRLRLRDLQRECMLMAEHLNELEMAQLQPIWADLQISAI